MTAPPPSSCRRMFGSLCLFAWAMGCATERRDYPAEAFDLEDANRIVVRFDVRHQTMTGFGASSAWTAPMMSAALADELFSVEKGLGLSLLRIQIKPSGESHELETAWLARERGAQIWAAPWSPPAAWKTNEKTTDGGSLLPERFDDWAESLAGFAKTLSDLELPLLALSAQNEPDYSAVWDTCLWTPDELAEFIGDHLGPALTSKGLDTPVLAPETANWGSFARYGDAILAHPTAHEYVNAMATHSYGGSAFAYAEERRGDKELWQTEVSDSQSGGSQMDSALRVARMIHDHLTIANVSAWHYWWLVPNRGRPEEEAADTTSALLDDDLRLTRRAYVMGQFSKFVRPGFVRVEVSKTTATGVYATAFVEPSTGQFAIVVVNEHGREMSRDFKFLGGYVDQVVPWSTSGKTSLEAHAPVRGRGPSLSVELLPRSVTTLVGTLDIPEPDAGI